MCKPQAQITQSRSRGTLALTPRKGKKKRERAPPNHAVQIVTDDQNMIKTSIKHVQNSAFYSSQQVV